MQTTEFLLSRPMDAPGAGDAADANRHVTSIEARVDGSRVHAHYAVQSNMLTVWNPSLGSRTATLAGQSLPDLVDALIVEIVRDCGRYATLSSAGLR